MGEGKTNMFGKTYNTIGSTDSNFIIKTKGDLKVQWGGKFIDVIKNGKLASAGADILKVASSSDNISSNGVYLVPTDEGNEVWVSIDGTKVNIAGEVGTTYVSFLTEQKEVTADQKYTALVNAGLYYETLEDAQEAGVKAGLIFIVGENKLYIAKDGQLSEYIASAASSDEEKNTYFDEITVKDLKIYKEGSNMTIASPTLQFEINEQLALILDTQFRSYLNIAMQNGTYIQSYNATPSSGYRLYVKDGKSVLEVDSIVWRDMDQTIFGSSSGYLDDTIIYSTHGNVIQSAYEDGENITFTLRYPNKFSDGEKAYIIISLNIQVEIDYNQDESGVTILAGIGDVVASQDIKLSISYIADDVDGNAEITIPAGSSSATLQLPGVQSIFLGDYTLISGPDNIDDSQARGKRQLIEVDVINIEQQEITVSVEESIRSLVLSNCVDSLIYISTTQLIKISQNTIDILDRSKTIIDKETLEEKPDDTVHTRIGVINEQEFEELKKCPEEQEEVQVGIYSDNFIGLNSKLYDSVFKKRCDYPKYDESVEIPEDFQDEKYNKAVPNVEWIKELIKLAVPSGTIAMYNGQSEIPEGWAVCDGNNGTPNLVGKFIKAVSAIDQIGDNESELNENNELIITQEHLPKHSHPHKPHTHNLEGNLSGTTGSSGDLTVSLNYSDYNWGIGSVEKTFVTSVTGEGVTSETGTVDGVSNIRTQGGKATGGSHTHSISLDVEEGVSLSSATSKEETLKDSEWPNKPLKIEPRSYSLVFIMKL